MTHWRFRHELDPPSWPTGNVVMVALIGIAVVAAVISIVVASDALGLLPCLLSWFC